MQTWHKVEQVPQTGVVCFVDNLPPELLSRIFETGTTDSESDNCFSEVSGNSDYYLAWPPFHIPVSHVSRYWRDVALSTPSLWTTIVAGPAARPPYAQVSALLQRSKGFPIDIYVDCHDRGTKPSRPPSSADFAFLCSLLVPHIHRWRTIAISVSKHRRTSVFLTAVSDPSIPAAPRLTSLRLCYHEDTEKSGYARRLEPLVIFSGSAPCLTSIVLYGVHVDWSQPWIASASRLRHLEMAYLPRHAQPSWAQFSTILCGAPFLERLALRGFALGEHPNGRIIASTPRHPTDLNAPIRLLALTDIVLSFLPATHATEILHQCYLPALKHLDLEFVEEYHRGILGGDYTRFIRKLVRPALSIDSTPASERSRSLLSRLESLKVVRLPCLFMVQHIGDVYAELQNLTSLHISLANLPALFLTILGWPCPFPGLGAVWLPRLATLYVSGTSGDAIREVVQKRMQAGTPLDALYMEESCDVDDEEAAWLKKNVKTFKLYKESVGVM